MRKPVDPFGISILDLLSNALGASILLMLIVSIKSRGMGEIPNDAPPQVGTGKFNTLQMGKEKAVTDSPDYTIQIKLFNHKSTVNVTGNDKCEIYRTDSLDSNDYWLIKVDGNDKETVSVNFNSSNYESILVQSTVFRGSAPIWHEKKQKHRQGEKGNIEVIHSLEIESGKID